MDLSQLTIPVVMTFMLMLTRISGMLIASPLFGNAGIPQMVKIGLAIAITIIFFPLHSGAASYHPPTDLIQFTVLAVQEFIVGLLIGFAAELLFTAIRMAGELVGLQMGMTIANVIDPVNHSQSSIFSQVYFIFALLLFLSMNVHHGLIVALDRSFDWVPLGAGLGSTAVVFKGHHAASFGAISERFVVMGADVFKLGLLLGLPLVAILLVTEISMAFVAKVMPQMNIFMVGLPLKVTIGLIAVMISLPYTAKALSGHYDMLLQHVMGLFRGA